MESKPRQRGFDFHLHSWYSYDAQLCPEEIFRAADGAGLEAIAITDHHNMDGFADFIAAAEAFPAVKWVPGMELSVATEWGDFDVVALGVPPDAPARVAGVIDLYRQWMRRFNRRLLAGFRALGVPFRQEEKEHMLATWRPGPAGQVQGEVRIPNRGLIPWLLENGVLAEAGEFAGLMQRAFREAGGRPKLPPAREVLPRFLDLGAVLLLAHPQRFLEDRGSGELDKLIRETGIDGIETGHIAHSPEQASRYLDFARSRGLFVSGGTDAHFRKDLDGLGEHSCEAESARPLMERLGL